jgi:CubicO group peptidase (beta-lactamase class C family)
MAHTAISSALTGGRVASIVRYGWPNNMPLTMPEGFRMISRRFNLFRLLTVTLWLTYPATKAASQDVRAGRTSLDQKALDDLTAYIEKARVQWAMPGLAVTIVKDDKVVMARGFGVREIGKAARVDEHTIFALSSMGKAFAAAAVGTVVDEGKIGWDDPIVKHLPWFQMSDPWVTRQVTLRDLLSHKSGMGDETWAATNASREELVRRVRNMNQVSSFRSHYNYSNVGITTAGLAAAAAAGLDWHTLMRSRILQPLHMDSSTTDLSTLWDPADVAPCYLCSLDHPVGIERSRNRNIVMPHVWEDGKTKVIPWRTVENIAPAGSINSNAVDMAQWLRLQLGHGMYDDRRVLSGAALKEMHSPQNVIRANELPIGETLVEAPDRFHFWAYGLGWRMNDYRSRKMIWHTGGITGFYSIMALLPDANLGVVVLTNSWRSSPNLLTYAIVLRVFDAYLRATPEDWSTELLARSEEQRAHEEEAQRRLEAARITTTSPSLRLDAYSGRYVHPAHDEMKIEMQNGQLRARFPSTLSGTLEHWQFDTFRVRWDSPSRSPTFATFVLDPQHRVVGLQLQGLGEFRKLSE